ncbi:MAG TPA: putative toxin-antitoxin system toxin component, PIN family [Gammaproteobacteria bacterium]|nr:putative toxin-antitoxin system toxin component, PIN family [Gammaproteobacteria bacterium]
MRVIVDTNVFMSGMFWSGPPAKILKAWWEKKLNLVLSTDILDEYIRVGNILSKKYHEIGVGIDEVIESLIIRSNLCNVTPLPASVCRDPNDDMFIACALSANVKKIISGDADLLVISGYQGVHVMKSRDFCDIHLSAP